MVAFKIDPLNVPKHLTDAVAQMADEDADLVIEFLGKLPTRPTLSDSELLELGAYLRIIRWAQDRIFEGMCTELPTVQAAAATFLESSAPLRLSLYTMRTLVKHVAWTSQVDVGAQIALDGDLNDEQLDQLATFLLDSLAESSQPLAE